jgi:ribonuclease P protein component
LPRAARLRSRPQFVEALAQAPAGVRRHFKLYARANGLDHARIGIVASKRAAPRAVDRNRAKRLVREVFRLMRARLGGTDVIVQLRRWSPRGSLAPARVELARLLEELAARKRPD